MIIIPPIFKGKDGGRIIKISVLQKNEQLRIGAVAK